MIMVLGEVNVYSFLNIPENQLGIPVLFYPGECSLIDFWKRYRAQLEPKVFLPKRSASLAIMDMKDLLS